MRTDLQLYWLFGQSKHQSRCVRHHHVDVRLVRSQHCASQLESRQSPIVNMGMADAHGLGATDASSSQLAPPIDHREPADDGPNLWENVDSDIDDAFSIASGSEVVSRDAANFGWAALLTNLGSPCVGAAVSGEDEAFEDQFDDRYGDADLAGIRKQSVFLRPSSSK